MKTVRFLKGLLAVLVAGVTGSADSLGACQLQIIHTNDLHSHLDHADRPETGGYAAVKARIDLIRAQAHARGMETLVLDAGDFLEGSEYFIAKRGLDVFQVMNSMGYDAVTLGNHDFLMGENALDQLVGQAQPSFPLLGANFIFDRSNHNLARSMRQWIEVEKCGVHIAILGLTTDDPQYSWRMDQGFIANPIEEAIIDLPELRRRNDFVIALTHLGITKDRQLIQSTHGIDLVVGGHDHTRLEHPQFEKDQQGRWVGIVEAGRFGQAVGNLIVSLTPGQPLAISNYGLSELEAGAPQDAKILQQVAQTNTDIENEYGTHWWNDTLAFSDVPLTSSSYATTEWSDLIVDGMRSATQTDFALDVSVFNGMDQPPGPITHKSIIAAYPRMFETDHRMGWTIWTGEISGEFLKIVINLLISQSQTFSVSGFDLEMHVDPGTQHRTLTRILHHGSPIAATRRYTIALPEGLVRGALSMTSLFKAVYWNSRNSGIPIWNAIDRRLQELGGVRARNSSVPNRIRIL